MLFHLTCVHIILVRFRLLSCHILGNSCSFGLLYVLFCILSICNISYFPFWFWGLDLGCDCFSSTSLHTYIFGILKVACVKLEGAG